MLAIPYFARQNRLAETGRLARPETAGDPAIDYSGGSSINSGGVSPTTNTTAAANASAGRSRSPGSRFRRDGASSMVWIKDE
jgi:hypothetical protein